jgi:hypothetical protein
VRQCRVAAAIDDDRMRGLGAGPGGAVEQRPQETQADIMRGAGGGA